MQDEKDLVVVCRECAQRCVPMEQVLGMMKPGAFSGSEFEIRGGGVVVGMRRLSDGRVAKAYFNFADECREADGIFLPPHFARLSSPEL